jgi:hypothetical protein
MFRYPAGRVCLIFYRTWCQTLSKIWLTYRKTAEQCLCSSKAWLFMFVMWWLCCIVEWALWNPNWWEYVHTWRFVSLYILLNRSFSRIFDQIDRRLSGLYDATSVGFFPGFWIMVIFACFKGAGQYCNLRIALKMYRRAYMWHFL